MNVPIANNDEESEMKTGSQALWNALSSPLDRRGGRTLFAFYKDRHQWRRYGSLKSFCWASHLLSPLSLFWWMSELFIVLTALLFFFQLHPAEILVPLVTCGLAFFELVAFYKTCLKDPGVLPRPEFAIAFRNLLGVVSLSELQKDDDIQRVCRFRMNSEGKPERQSFCWRCKHYRPPKTFHCKDCDCCIMNFDHHCPIIGGCITDKNYVSFVMMVLGQLMFWCYVWGYSIYCIFTYDKLGNGLMIPTVVLIELLLAILLPLIVLLCEEKICIRPYRVVLPLVIKEEDVDELLSFAVINNFAKVEMDMIYELYHGGADDGCTSAKGSGDMKKVRVCSNADFIQSVPDTDDSEEAE